MTLTLKHYGPALLIMGAVAVLATLFTAENLSGYTRNDAANRVDTYVLHDFFASSTIGVAPTEFATSTTATSTNITPYFDEQGRYQDGTLTVAGAERVSMYFTRGTGTSGATRFRVQGTQDGINWHYVSRFIGDDSGSTATSSTIFMNNTATTTAIYGLDVRTHGYQKIRCIAVETTDGRHQCQALVEW